MRTQKFFAPLFIVIALIAFMFLDGFYTVGERRRTGTGGHNNVREHRQDRHGRFIFQNPVRPAGSHR